MGRRFNGKIKKKIQELDEEAQFEENTEDLAESFWMIDKEDRD